MSSQSGERLRRSLRSASRRQKRTCAPTQAEGEGVARLGAPGSRRVPRPSRVSCRRSASRPFGLRSLTRGRPRRTRFNQRRTSPPSEHGPRMFVVELTCLHTSRSQRVPDQHGQIGISNTQVRPSAAKTMFVPRWVPPRARSISMVPKPVLCGGETGGPPVSRQQILARR